MVADVLVEVKSKNINKTFLYLIPDNLSILVGMRVIVPFGKQKVFGFVLSIHEKNNELELKKILEVVDEKPVLNAEMLEIGKFISKKTLTNLITCYQSMLPAALKAKKNISVNKKYDVCVKLNFVPNKLTVKQNEVIDFIKKNDIALRSDVNKISVSSVKSLADKGVISFYKVEKYRLKNDFKKVNSNICLNSSQQFVVDEVLSNVNVFCPYLLYGVTGSGKTEVYMHIIEKIINIGKTAIVLVPEISLTPQMVNVFGSRFGSQIAILHSRLNDGEKYDEWRKIERGEVSIVIGARSAIFAPFSNIGVIIIDEEHSENYKQENNPKYNAIDIAITRAKKYSCPLILGSATPSIESYTRANLGIYKLLTLKSRINNKVPKVILVDMKKQIKKGNNILSDILINKINDRLSKHEQIIILLNRRGYSTVLTCQNCGNTCQCPNCDIPLTYHKTSNVLRCHYCGYAQIRKKNCSNCNSLDISEYGIGTQKLEEYICSKFNAKVVRMDVDTTTKKGSHEQIINDFKEHKFDILIGTQMISKGLDFELVTLVGVLNCDSSLNVPDFRSCEKTFQLLNQIAGRAGRGSLDGEVVMQGFNIDNYSIVLACNNDYESFYKKEIEIRKKLKYPPFFNICLIKMSGINNDILNKEAIKIRDYLVNNLSSNLNILGPNYSNMPKINNVYYMQIIIKYKNINEIYDILSFLVDKYRQSRSINIDIDFNPIKI